MIDTTKATTEEIKEEIVRLGILAKESKNEEQAIKLAINSIYGGLGNKWFVAFNTDVAESVTMQGQDLIKFAEITMNEYFNEHWHLDTELHEKMGIIGEVKRVKQPVNIYSDTDSCYVTFEEVLKSCIWTGEPKDFILKINDYRLTQYLMEKFNVYAKKWGCDKNLQDFELENISESGIWLAKKKYMLNPIWESGIDVVSRSHIVYKGVELAQSVTPMFARKKLKELMDYIFEKKNNLIPAEMIRLLREIKKEFMCAEPEDISLTRSVNDYSKYVINDTTGIEVVKMTPIHVRAAAVYNHYLHNNASYKARYELITGKTRIKFYYVKQRNNVGSDVFGFPAGAYPVMFAPEIDYDIQFSNMVIGPINRIMQAMGHAPISEQLVRPTAVF